MSKYWNPLRVRALRIALIVLCFVLATGLLNTSNQTYAASKSKKMTVYDQVIKKGNYAYCTGVGRNLYKVNLKTGKVTNLITGNTGPEVHNHVSYVYPIRNVRSMKLKGKYLYYISAQTQGPGEALYRINVNTGKIKRLASTSMGRITYVIKGSKIYYYIDKMDGKKRCKVMKLNGKSRKKTSIVPKMKSKKSNVKGYSSIINDVSKETDYEYIGDVRTYLVAPGRTILTAKHIAYVKYTD